MEHPSEEAERMTADGSISHYIACVEGKESKRQVVARENMPIGASASEAG
jgi:hypothetical protein